MKKFAQLNEQGLPTAFYSDDINTNIPTDAVEITEAQWMEFIENQCLRKWDGENVVEYIPPVPTTDELLVGIRKKRNALLKDCDWTQVLDAPVSQIEWETYRKVLRDFPSECDPADPAWPEVPAQ